jgi:hypothetical protein
MIRVDATGFHREILVQVECYDSGEVQAFLTVEAD